LKAYSASQGENNSLEIEGQPIPDFDDCIHQSFFHKY